MGSTGLEVMKMRMRTTAIGCTLIAIAAMIIRDRMHAMPLRFEAYSKAALDERLTSGQTVLITVFGLWTHSTQFNDEMVRKSPVIRDVCRAKNIAFMRADWTTRTPEVDALMSEYGLRSVPATLIYCPNRKQPQILLDLFTEDELATTIRCACKAELETGTR